MESFQQAMYAMSLVSILPLVIRSKDNLLAWAIVTASFLFGLQVYSIASGAALLLLYAMIDGIAGVLVQTPSRWPYRLMGSAYGVMGLSHVTVHFGLMTNEVHAFIGAFFGWALFVILACLGVFDGGHRDRGRTISPVGIRANNTGKTTEKAS